MAQASSSKQQLFVRTKDGGVFVPPSIQYLSTYVLLEQEDWFEKEIRFVRTFLEPGMRAIDVGANYGVYTVAMGRAVKSDGAVWAFEPTEQTLGFLRQTVTANSLSNVSVCPVALSDHAGTGFLSLQANCELNTLVAGAAPSAQPVQLSTLEAQHAALGMGTIDFIKLDAEGAELSIIDGSRRFFSEQSPLVMFEVKTDVAINAKLPEAFRGLGYGIYRLVGPDTLLVPVSEDEALDRYELNLFACKPERAKQLAARRLLVEHIEPAPTRLAGSGLAFWRTQPFASGWMLPHDTFAPAWADHYAYWRDLNNPLAARYGALLAAIVELHALPDDPPTLAGLGTRARLLLEAGCRQDAVQALSQLLRLTDAAAELGTGLLWPPSVRFDSTRPIGAPRQWLIAAAIHAYAAESNFSDYFKAATYLPMLDWLQDTPYGTAPMERRRQLQAMLANRPSRGGSSALLAVTSPEHLNAGLWRGRS
jgi:FkbM family methyltransferase